MTSQEFKSGLGSSSLCKQFGARSERRDRFESRRVGQKHVHGAMATDNKYLPVLLAGEVQGWSDSKCGQGSVPSGFYAR